MNASVLWSSVVLISVLLLGAVALRLVARRVRARRVVSAELRQELAELPMSPLQRRAWVALVLVAVSFLACFAIVSGSGGAAVYWDDDAVRLTVTGIFIATLVLHAVILYLPVQQARSGQRFDERDRRILENSPAFQSAAMLLAMVAWDIYLVESSRPERTISTVYLYLMFGTMIFAQLAATDLGILFGYWSGIGDVEE
jgi:hypothetical protein